MAEDGSTILTARWWARKLYGAKWLGNASLDEYAAATYFEEHNVPYMYQAPFGTYQEDIFVDFQLLGMGQRIVIEIQGDRFHEGNEQIAIDRQRILLVEAQGVTVVQVWGDQLMHYTGHVYPTWASYERVMEAAVQGVELPHN